jgi:uncharacterized membrane protein YphA (DoxX/SURF4 family)
MGAGVLNIRNVPQAQATLDRVALILRLGLCAIWLWSAFVSEFVATREVSLGLLAAVGITGDIAPLLLHGASLLDLVFGIATLLGILTRWSALAQVALMTIYTFVLVGHVPELWAHPFAPIGKNLTLAAAALALALTGGGRWSFDGWWGRRIKDAGEWKSRL